MGRRLAAAFGGVVALAVAGCSGDPFGELPDPRLAEDCVAFTREANADVGERTDNIVAPGQAPTVDVEAYWFGPTLGPRTAIVADEGQGDLSNSDEPELFPIYVVIYQLPADGCQSGLLPGYDPSPDYWGPGREIWVQSEPLAAPLVQRLIREVGGGIAGKPRVPVADGRSAVVLELGETTTGLVVDETFVLVQYAHPERVRALLPTLRRVGGGS